MNVMHGWNKVWRIVAILLLAGIVVCLYLNMPNKSMIQNKLTESNWVSKNSATISFLPSGEAHVINPTREIDVVGIYEVYILRCPFNSRIIVDVSIGPDERYAEYVLDGNALTSENGFCYYAT